MTAAGVSTNERGKAGTFIDATRYSSDISISERDNETDFLGGWHDIC
jgi:hypothetical protein